MSPQRPPDWYDRAGMQAWAEGMAAATRRRVSLLSLDETELLSVGIGEGDPARFPLEVNGQPVGWLELRPDLGSDVLTAQVMKAISTFRSLAEVRNSMADLVRTTARQWRELSLLYRSSDLLRVDQGRPALANNLLEQATGALRSELGLVRQGVGNEAQIHVSSGDDADSLIDVADWGIGLSEGVMVTEPAELGRLGFEGRAPDKPLLVVPLRCRDHCFGSLVLAASPKRPLSSEDLKLASLLADQAGKAFDNLQLVDQVRDSERLKRELEVASEIQSSILPPADITLEWLDFAGVCKPAKWVGGDTFLFGRQSDAAILTGVADVCGHGISSALLMNAFASSIEALSMTQAQPGRLLAITNDLLENRIGSTGLFVTAALMRVTSDGELTIASAGHPEVSGRETDREGRGGRLRRPAARGPPWNHLSTRPSSRSNPAPPWSFTATASPRPRRPTEPCMVVSGLWHCSKERAGRPRRAPSFEPSFLMTWLPFAPAENRTMM